MPRKKNPDSNRRSPSGMGSISQRASDGRWWARITLDDGTRKAYYGKTEDEVRRKLIDALSDKQKGQLITGRVPTLAEFTARWLETVAKPKVKASTYVGYKGLFKRHILPSLGKVRLNKLTPERLQRLYENKGAVLAPRHVGSIHRLLHVALKTALRWGYVQRNVADLVDPPRVKRSEYSVLDIKQAGVFLQAIQGDLLEAYYMTALTTGMRAGELRALKWGDIDLDKGIVSVQRSMRRVPKMGWIESEPKTSGSRRAIPLIRPTVEALRMHRTKQLEARLQMGPLWHDDGRVFTNSVGRPMEDPNTLQRSLRPLLARTGLPPMRFHDLRHSCASILLALNVPLKVVSELLGHSNISITADTYTTVFASTTREAVDRLNSLFETSK